MTEYKYEYHGTTIITRYASAIEVRFPDDVKLRIPIEAFQTLLCGVYGDCVPRGWEKPSGGTSMIGPDGAVAMGLVAGGVALETSEKATLIPMDVAIAAALNGPDDRSSLLAHDTRIACLEKALAWATSAKVDAVGLITPTQEAQQAEAVRAWLLAAKEAML